MRVAPTDMAGVRWIEPKVHRDPRGFFVETYHQERYRSLGIEREFVQDNHSRSPHGILRGLHYQWRRPQGKLCYVIRGEVFDVLVDLRLDSPTFGCWGGANLSDENHCQLFIPPGFAHGFCVLSEWADFAYKCMEVFEPLDQHTLAWNDPLLAIDWPLESPILSEKDQLGLPFAESAKFTADQLSA